MIEKDSLCLVVQDDTTFVYNTVNSNPSSNAFVLPNNDMADTRVRFNKLFNQWWDETCVFSGRSFFIANPNFKEMLKMGSSILPLVKEKMQNEPQYKQRALQWLFDAVVAL